MSELIFCPPEGEIVHDPSIDLIRRIILAEDQEYWMSGSADAGLHFDNHKKKSSLVLKFRKGLGYLVHVERSTTKLPLVLSSKAKDEQIIKLNDGQNILKVPKSYFVPASVALPAILEFMKSGEASPDANWIVFSPIKD